MRIKTLTLENYRGFDKATIPLGAFSCLVGPNGIGKSSTLNAIQLLCSSLDFNVPDDLPSSMSKAKRANAKRLLELSAAARMKAYLRKNIKGVDDSDNENATFLIAGEFEHEGKSFEVVLNQDGWVKNEIVNQPWWWPGLAYFTQFDTNLSNFQLASELWPTFAKAWETVSGFPARDPELFEVKSAKGHVAESVIINFWYDKPKQGAVMSRKASDGEKKLMKILSMIVSMEIERQPDIVLIDNIELHIAFNRHLPAVEEFKKLLAGKQIVATSHSMPIIMKYQPRKDIVDLGLIVTGEAYTNEFTGSSTQA